MVGDSGADVGAARAAGVPVLVVPYGYTRVPVEDLDADGRVERLDALPDAIAELRAAARRRSTNSELSASALKT